MTTTYKDIVITPYRGDANNDPVIKLSAGDSTTNADMNIRFYATTNGTLSFEGSAGQLFSITNDLSNSIFSVNDVSGIPSIDVNANGLISLSPFGGNVSIKGNTFFVDSVNNRVGIGTTAPNNRFELFGGLGPYSLFRSTQYGVYARQIVSSAGLNLYNSDANAQLAGGTGRSMYLEGATGICLAATYPIAFSGGADAASGLDTYFLRDAANTLAQRNGTAAQVFRIYNTYTDASNYERLNMGFSSNICYIETTGLGTGSQRNLAIGGAIIDFRTGTNSRWNLNGSGHFIAATDNTYDIGASGANRPRDIYVANNVNANVSFQVKGKKAVNGPAFSAYVDLGIPNQLISSGSQQKVLFTLEEYDTDNCFANSTFTPTVEGYYQLNSTVRIDGGGAGTGELMIVIYKNGAEYKRGWNSTGVEPGNSWFAMSVNSLVYANGTTDYFDVYIQQGSGSNRNVTRGAALSWFNGTMVRGA